MNALRNFLERLLGPDAAGRIPPRPDGQQQQRIDRAVKQIEKIERDIFTEHLRQAWRDDTRSSP